MLEHSSSDVDLAKGKILVSVPQFSALQASLIISVLLATVTQSMVAASLKSIVSTLGNYVLLPWVGSAYLMSMIPTVLLFDKVSRRLGLKWSFLGSLLIFEIGSVVSSQAHSMQDLIAGRVVAGIGGGGLVVSYSLISNLLVCVDDGLILFVKPQSIYEGLSGIFLLVSTIGAPVVGGAFSDHLSWRWCFYLELFVGLIPAIIMTVLLDTSPIDNAPFEHLPIDFAGVFLFFTGVACLLIPLQFYPILWEWNSAQSIVMFVVSVVAFVLCGIAENQVMVDPVVPRGIFSNAAIPALIVISFCSAATFVGAVWNVGIFLQINFGDNQTIAGAYMISAFVGLLVGNRVSKFVGQKFGYVRPFFYISPVVSFAGVMLLAYLGGSSDVPARVLYLFVLGVGDGFSQVMRIWALHVAIPIAEYAERVTFLGVVAALFGSSFSITVTGTIAKAIYAHAVDTSPQIQDGIQFLSNLNITITDTDAYGLISNLHWQLQKANSTDPMSADTHMLQLALSTLLEAYNAGYRTSIFSLIVYPVVMLGMAYFIKPFVVEDMD
ncbi:hypothetical protein HDU98_007265 [Podochytrium sp. JEL0797]|nr:hypothetical protein HDU98_007265 [Podochytrium sp. JEL0797]